MRMRAMLKNMQNKGIKPLVLLAYVLGVGLFIAAFARYYIPEKGFSYLISFGGKQAHRTVDELKNLDFYVQADSEGYDAQYYVQIAMHPDLREPRLKEAVDSLPYRARRILICWASYVMGFGQPEGVMAAYVLQNALCWFLLAGLLLRWFPPTSWSNLLRWSGVLFSFGMCVSVRNSLVDGPSLLLIAIGVMLYEKGKPWWSTAVFAISGLGKETNMLGAAALAPWKDIKKVWRWPMLLLRGVLVALPLALWLIYIDRVVGPAADMGVRNFDWPLMGYARKWQEVGNELVNPDSWAMGIFYCRPLWSVFMLVALTTQFLFLVFRPAIKQPWWRIGISFAVLMLVLGDAVWEGYPGAGSRVLLPMQLVFNVLVPRGRAWLPVLILGNLTLLGAPSALQPPEGDGYQLNGTVSVMSSLEGGRFRVVYGEEWHEPERHQERYWRWCRASSEVAFHNPHPFALEAEMNFILSSLEPKGITLSDGENNELWSGQIKDGVTRVHLEKIVLQPGSNVIYFKTDDQVIHANKDPRRLSYCLKDWVIDLKVAPHDGIVLTGPVTIFGANGHRLVKVDFLENWFEAERQNENYWRWTGGSAELLITNNHSEVVHARLSFMLNGISKRTVILSHGERTLWEGKVSSKNSEKVELDSLGLNPGITRLRFKSDRAASGADNDNRLLDLSVKNLRLELSAP